MPNLSARQCLGLLNTKSQISCCDSTLVIVEVVLMKRVNSLIRDILKRSDTL